MKTDTKTTSLKMEITISAVQLTAVNFMSGSQLVCYACFNHTSYNEVNCINLAKTEAAHAS